MSQDAKEMMTIFIKIPVEHHKALTLLAVVDWDHPSARAAPLPFPGDAPGQCGADIRPASL